MNQIWKEKIETETKNNKVVIYMRGSPTQPRCGFSARVIRVFTELNVEFKSEDMDSDPALWQTLSEMNNWPTSPQIYINGEFVGGCDIVTEMHRSGELQKELGLA
jgi:monothiol glutaredoxin